MGSGNMTFREFCLSYIFRLKDTLSVVNIEELEKIVRVIEEDKNLFVIGNGGSAATASHFVEDLAYTANRNNVIGLVDSVPAITALSNDYGYDWVFVKQLENLYKDGDILFAISCSGSSMNVCNAINFVKQRGGTVIGLVGAAGGNMYDICDLLILIEDVNYGTIEDMHEIICHIITYYLMERN